MTIFLVRHGETAFNRDSQGLGRADVPLTRLGLAQAGAVAERLAGERVKEVLSSPLGRASTVAARVADRHRLEVVHLEALTELDVGETEGMAFPQMRQRFPDFLKVWASDDGWQARMPGGESIEDLAARLDPVAGRLLEFDEGDAVVVSHNFTLRVLLCRLLGLSPAKFRSFEIGLATVTSLNVRNGRASVRNVNDTCHLRNLNLA